VLYLSVALMWLIPDRRIERALAASSREGGERMVDTSGHGKS
jgi:hypothetical protein